MKISFSFIIPHRNSLELLKRCISSIPQKKFVEIIVVDDNSATDVIYELQQYGAHIPQLKILYSDQNIGAGAARNLGLDLACGKWFIFADCDDFFHENIIVELLYYKEYDNVDLVLFNTDSVDSVTMQSIKSRGCRYNHWIANNIGKTILDPKLRYCINPPWGKFISSKVVKEHNIRFDEEYAANDVMFSIKIGHYSENIKLSTSVIYCATDCPNSIQKITTLKHQNSRLNVIFNNYSFLKSVNQIKYRMNIWKVIFRFYFVNDREPFLFYVKLALKNIDAKHLVVDLMSLPILGLTYLIKK